MGTCSGAYELNHESAILFLFFRKRFTPSYKKQYEWLWFQLLDMDKLLITLTYTTLFWS